MRSWLLPALATVVLAASGAAARPSLVGKAAWACYYGGVLSKAAWGRLEVAILEPDAFELHEATGPLTFGYLSVGELNEARPEWQHFKDKPWVVEPNPEWPGAHRVDLRAPEWREHLVKKAVPAILAKGYQGVMLDTIDVAGYLESSAPARFPGSTAAASELVLELRRTYPELLILVNNGLPLLDGIGAAVDGVVVEDLYTRCPPDAAEPCGPTPPPLAADREARLKAFREDTGKPVFVFVYARLGQWRSKLVRRAVRRSMRNRFLPYVATPALDRLGIPSP